MKRPILIATIGYIIGIIAGLYFDKSIVFLYAILFICYIFYEMLRKKQFKLISIKRYIRYIKLYLNTKVIMLLIIVSVISNSIILFSDQKYQNIYKKLEDTKQINLIAIIISNKEEKQYSNKYVIREIKTNKKFYITTNKDIDLDYGDKVQIIGKYVKPESSRNYGGFDYSEYLKQLKIYGTINAEQLNTQDKNQANIVLSFFNKLILKAKEETSKLLDETESSIFYGLVLGDTSEIEINLKQDFSNAGISHILAVSGLHVLYLMAGTEMIFKKIFGKRSSYIITILILIFYMFISDFSPSIVRAGVMGIILISSKLFYKRDDTLTSLSLSMLLILIYNPYLIASLSVQLSYIATLGILCLNKFFLKILEKFKFKEIISVSLSVQFFIFPIMLYHLNTFNIYFLISNILLSFVIAPIVISSFIFLAFILLNIHFEFFSFLIGIGIKILIFISKIGELPFSKIYFPTPNISNIIFYYSAIILIKQIYYLYKNKNLNITQRRFRNLIALVKFRIKEKKLIFNTVLIFIIIFVAVIKITPRDLKIYFIDVGQGDSTFIVTPQNKTILIDGGGNTFSDFDVGKNVLLPYILDRGYIKIDIMIISHFDDDHVGGLFSIIEELEVKQIFISQQYESSSNYRRLVNLARKYKIKLNIVRSRTTMNIEENLKINFLWPINELLEENPLNNNSLVCKIEYKRFSMLFTGDIEEIAEKRIVELYKNSDVLKSTILKVAHHGSKTSSTEEFLKMVNPKIALIGVGKNNKFGHPNEITLKKLNQINCNIHRTDENGEISVMTDGISIKITEK